MTPRIGILCSGGDGPGMNAGVAAAACRVRAAGGEPVGIPGGDVGLSAARQTILEPDHCESQVARGGCFLGSSRRPPEMTETELLDRAREGCAALGLAGLIVFGGNGSLRGLAKLAPHLPCIGVPSTIDNDLAGSLLSIGFDTARQYGVQALDGIRDTGEALPGRVFAVQTLGGSTGHLALAVAYSGFAPLVLVPEIEEPEDRVVRRARECLGRSPYVAAVVSEGSPWVDRLEATLHRALGFRIRPTILGYAQRGGVPTAADRALARSFGIAAAEAVLQRHSGATVWDGTGVSLRELLETAALKPIDREIYRVVWE